MFCKKCGNELADTAKFCTKCGTKTEETPAPIVEEPKKEQKQKKEKPVKEKVVYAEPTYVNIPPEYKPISMWGYFGYEILFSIPIIGWLLLLIFALGGHSNKNVRNFAASYFCGLILLIIIILIVVAVGGVGLLSFMKNANISII